MTGGYSTNHTLKTYPDTSAKAASTDEMAYTPRLQSLLGQLHEVIIRLELNMNAVSNSTGRLTGTYEPVEPSPQSGHVVSLEPARIDELSNSINRLNGLADRAFTISNILQENV